MKQQSHPRKSENSTELCKRIELNQLLAPGRGRAGVLQNPCVFVKEEDGVEAGGEAVNVALGLLPIIQLCATKNYGDAGLAIRRGLFSRDLNG